MLDVNAFNFEVMKEAIGSDPFADNTNKYAKDERFYTLSKDKNGNGAALIRFLPDCDRAMIQKLFKINTTVTKNGKKRFVSEFSPSTIGLPCPFQEKWQDLWNAGDKEGAKLYGRGTKYITNIKVLKDPANPENEGKIFLYEMSGAMRDKIQNAVDPSEQDRSLGAVPKEMFNPLRGNSFRLVAKRGANNQINYDSSEVINEITSIYETTEDALDDVNNKTHRLSDFLKPEAFLSYDELVKKMNWVNFGETNQTTTIVAEVAEVAKVEPEVRPVEKTNPAPVAQEKQTQGEKSNSLDSLLAGLV